MAALVPWSIDFIAAGPDRWNGKVVLRGMKDSIDGRLQCRPASAAKSGNAPTKHQRAWACLPTLIGG